ncbi:MAG: aminotransferase class V-fold PLP-dependent enzyme [Planctomycetes bacterium]|nr:aminotransferase class V-fold PLP-dependent enzyme [Planctomycetota bacterium]
MPPIRHYFDHAATSPIREDMIDQYNHYLREFSWNAGTVYEGGLNSKKALETARGDFSQFLSVQPETIIFTSGGTESNNLAIHAFSKNKKQGVIWLSKTVHPSQKEPAMALAEKGWQIIDLPTRKSGVIDLSRLDSLPDPDLFVCEWVNSEAGFIQPIAELGQYLQDHHSKCHLLVDGVQGFAKVKLPPLKNVHAFSISGHKVGAPVGVGALMLKHKKTCALNKGGGQEGGWRSGTVAVPAICIFRDTFMKMSKTPLKLTPSFSQNGPSIIRNNEENYTPAIWLLNTAPVDGEVLLHQLESYGVAVGLGSACKASRKKISETHRALGLDDTSSRKTLRLSLSPYTDQDSLTYTCELIEKLWNESKKFF